MSSRFASLPLSPLPGVSRESWKRFVDTLAVQVTDAVSDSGGLGEYDMRPRRLVELGYASGLKYTKNDIGRYIYECEFTGKWTKARFLANSVAQYAAFCNSISLYYRDLMDEKVKRPEGVSLAGVLTILHRGGRGALVAWPELFDHTRQLYEAARGAF